MSKFNNDVLAAREVQKQYLIHNEKTVEKMVGYDSKLKCRFYSKVQIDPKSKDFKKSFIKSENIKKKNIQDNKITKSKVADHKSKNENSKTKKIKSFQKNTKIEKVYELYTQGLSPLEISTNLNIPIKNVSSKISTRKKQLNIKKPAGEKLKLVEKYYLSGMKRCEIAELLNLAPRTLAPYITEIRKRNNIN